jgi:hypothetical protein
MVRELKKRTMIGELARQMNCNPQRPEIRLHQPYNNNNNDDNDDRTMSMRITVRRMLDEERLDVRRDWPQRD